MKDKKKKPEDKSHRPQEPLDVFPELVKTVVHETSGFLGRMVSLFLAGPERAPGPEKEKAPASPHPEQGGDGPGQEETGHKPAQDMSAREIIASLPQRFLPDKARGQSIVLHIEFEDEPEGRFTVHVAEGKCWVEPGLAGSPDCLIRTQAPIYRDIELGRMNPRTAYLFGKVKISDVTVLTRFAGLFRPVTEVF